MSCHLVGSSQNHCYPRRGALYPWGYPWGRGYQMENPMVEPCSLQSYPCNYPLGKGWVLYRADSPLSVVCISSLFPVAQLFRVRECPFHCGQAVGTDVLLGSMSAILAAHALVVGPAGLGAGPGWGISSLTLPCSQEGPGMG